MSLSGGCAMTGSSDRHVKYGVGDHGGVDDELHPHLQLRAPKLKVNAQPQDSKHIMGFKRCMKIGRTTDSFQHI